MRFAEDAAGTEPFCLKASRAGFDAESFGEPVGRDDDAVAASAAADPDGPALQLGIERDFATGEEGISVNVQNPVVPSAHR